MGVRIIVGNNDSSSQFLDNTPIKKPKRLKVKEVKTSIKTITKGCIIFISTKKRPVPKINPPIIIDLVVAAPTKPIIISVVDKGAAYISLIVPKNLGKNIPDEAFETLCVSKANIIIPGTINDPYETSSIIGMPLKEIKLPKNVSIGSIVKKDNEIIPARGSSTIDPGDKLVMFVPVKSIKKVQELLSVRLDYF